MICSRNKYHGYGKDGRRLYFKGGGDGNSSTTTAEIPNELKPLAAAYTDKAINLGNQGFTPFQGQRYAELNGLQNAAIGQIANRALNGSQTVDSAESALNGMISGTSNPYLDSMVQQAQDSVKSNFNTAAVNSGSFGNSGLQEQFGKDLGNVATNMYGNAYAGDRSNQLAAIQYAPTIANQDYADANQLMSAGQTLQDQAQQQNDFNYSQYQDAQNLPYKQLAAMSGVFGTNLGGSSTTKQSNGGGK